MFMFIVRRVGNTAYDFILGVTELLGKSRVVG